MEAVGVRFAGDFSYTGRFDGKQYDVKNSRNDTVALAMGRPAHRGCDVPARQPGHAEGSVGDFKRWTEHDTDQHRYL